MCSSTILNDLINDMNNTTTEIKKTSSTWVWKPANKKPVKIMTTIEATQHNACTPLFRLPPELRNRIYSYALVSPTPILTNAAWTPPALLSASSQIRHETKRLYYASNHFCVPVVSCDAALLARFQQHVISMGLKLPNNFVNFSVATSGKPNWGKLMEWCKMAHLGSAGSLEESGEEVEMSHGVVVAATKMAREMHGMPWEVAERVLAGLKGVARSCKGEWEDDVSAP